MPTSWLEALEIVNVTSGSNGMEVPPLVSVVLVTFVTLIDEQFMTPR
jgi:hypothetical protein